MIDISIIARDLNLPPEKVQRTVELLDEGNTIPFITRFRKDETGGMDEEQILSVKQKATSLRALVERKAFVLKSIESQGKLTDELKVAIDKANTSRAVEDVYLPFKPRKKSRANEARQKGLAPLSEDIFNGTAPDVDLATKATEYVRVDKGLNSVDEVIRGVSDLLAERYADDVELRQQLRQLVNETGKLTAQSTVQLKAKEEADAAKAAAKKPVEKVAGEAPSVTVAVKQMPAAKEAESKEEAKPLTVAESAKPEVVEPAIETPEVGEAVPAVETPAEAKTETAVETASAETDAVVASSEADAKPEEKAAANSEAKTESPVPAVPAVPVAATKPKAKKKKKKKKPVDDPYKDYHNFKQPVKKFPNHRVLSINRGERAKKLKVKIECDEKQALDLAVKKLVPEDHPFANHLKTCVQDALSRMVLPSLEREIRREMTEAAEKHAVEVFANNLRNLLLQPPTRNRRVMAIDPGYKRGCSVVILEKNGDVLHSDHVFVVGNQTRRDESKKKVADLAKQYQIDLIAIGNGAACREAEQMVSDCIEANFADSPAMRYVMVNEAGASIYSTSEVGREELPDLSPAIRSAVSIGRRLQDPMSELVKISPANIGVGMYQHDVKAKHLSESLDEVVQFCVNRVGVDVNTASPSLLTYVSGLNSLTAKRLVEHRKEKGGFKNRQELKEVSGVGDATFIQAAGFLRITGGDSPLDSTSIHPESYPIAEQIIQRVDATAADLFPQIVRVQQQIKAAPVVAAVVAPEKIVAAEASVEAASVEAASVEAASVEPASVEPTAEVSPETALPTVENSEPTATAEPAATSEANPESETATAEKPAPTPEPASASTPEPVVPPASVRPKPSPEVVAARKKRREIVEKISALELESLTSEISAGRLLLTDIVRTMKRPDWDPREKVRKPVFRRGMIKTDDLKPGMQLEAQVVNVVDFGVFVDIGLGESCLVHVSQLSNRFIRDPQVMYSVGDVIHTWVSEIEPKKRRVKLTAIRPGSERSRSHAPRGRKPEGSGERKTASSGAPQGRSGGKPPHARSQRGRPATKKSWKPKPRAPKPVTPITDDMLKGEKPMTSFSDLLQFVKKKPEDSTDE